MHFKIVVALLLSGVILITDAAPAESSVSKDEQLGGMDLLKDLSKDVIHEDRAAFLEKHQHVFRTISLADVPIDEAALTGFQTIDKDAAPDAGPDEEPADEKPTSGAFQADMMLTDEQWEELNKAFGYDEVDDSDDDDDDDSSDEDQPTRRAKRKAIALTKHHWPHGIVPVEFNLDTDEKQKKAIEAMVHWMDRTCLLFVHYNQGAADYLGHSTRLNLVGDQSGCWSYVGRVLSGRQTVSIGNGCGSLGIIVHELGHAIGFHHEQSRPDRDSYITVHTDNISSDRLNNFRKYTWDNVASHGVPYDLESIMHYGAYGFSKNGRRTITTNDSRKQSLIGQRVGLSNADIQMANNMYDCPA